MIMIMIVLLLLCVMCVLKWYNIIINIIINVKLLMCNVLLLM